MTTKIEWADETWNPITGCTKCSPACDHCQAERTSKRLAGRYGYPADDPFRVTLHPYKLAQPLHWKKPKRIFVVSMGDLFHPSVPNEYIAAVFGVMAAAHWHTFMVLTKRIERAAEWFRWVERDDSRLSPGEPWKVCRRSFWNLPFPATLKQDGFDVAIINGLAEWPLHNVMLGATIWDQPSADRAVSTLLKIPAAKRFASVEPMLGAVDLRHMDVDSEDMYWINALTGRNTDMGRPCRDVPCLDWVICGGETGPGARPMHPDWVRSLRDQCVEAAVPFLFKIWGEWAPHDHSTISEGMERCAWGTNKRVHVDISDGSIGGDPHIPGCYTMYRVGKKLAGRELDGRTWDQFPEV